MYQIKVEIDKDLDDQLRNSPPIDAYRRQRIHAMNNNNNNNNGHHDDVIDQCEDCSSNSNNNPKTVANGTRGNNSNSSTTTPTSATHHHIHPKLDNLPCDESLTQNQEKKEPAVEKLDDFIKFSAGNPCIEVTTGILHLFREHHAITPFPDTLPDERSKLICVLAVPSFLGPTLFLGFVEGFKAEIEYMRVLRDASPNRYMVLMKFNEQRSADQFYKQFHGRPFTDFDPEECNLVFVSRVEFITPKAQDFSSDNTEILFPHCKDNNNNNNNDSPRTVVQMFSPSSGAGSSSAASEDIQKTELPTCPVCLERLDASVSGIFTTLCNHSFHTDCMKKWGDSSCPVCRYNPESSDSECTICGAKENLWICLICGNIGCGRYIGAHARDHYEQTKHVYAMELETQRVWDYAGDGYVHRLIHNKTDGKLVELPDPRQGKKSRDYDPEAGEVLEAQFASKVEAICMEYNHLLAHQLESQRVYFESKMNKLAKAKDVQIEELEQEVLAQKAELEKLRAANRKLEKEKLAAEAKMNKMSEEYRFLKELNKTLLENQKEFRDKVESLQAQHQSRQAANEQQIAELQEQVKDLMFYLETQRSIESLSSEAQKEIKAGHMIITHSGSGSGSGSSPSPTAASSSGSSSGSNSNSGRGGRNHRNNKR